MSNALAIAAVTAVLRDLLNNGIIDHLSSVSLGSAVTVSTLPLDRIETGNKEQPQLNLFLYHITHNSGWRNAGLPSRDSRGDRVSNPPLALDLFYLLTAYGQDGLDSEILLGYGMQMLHETPVLTRDAIRKSLTPPAPPVDGSTLLPDEKSKLSAADLAEQVELIKISPHAMNSEEMTKLWTATQMKYRTSSAYHVSVVLIESQDAARSPLPVLSRGLPDYNTGLDAGVSIKPNLDMPLSPYPSLLDIQYLKQQRSAHLGENIILNGNNLNGSNITVHFSNPNLDQALEVAVTNSVNPDQLTVVLPSDKNALSAWPAGLYTVSASIQRPGDSYHQATNEISFSLAPSYTLTQPIDSQPDPDSPDLRNVTIILTCRPEVRSSQRISLLIGDRETLAEKFDGQTTQLVFTMKHVLPGIHLMRLRVDGVDSQFIDYVSQPPKFDQTQQVTIP